MSINNLLCLLIISYSFLKELKETLLNELDFEHEGINQEQCARQLSHLPFVHVPQVYWKYTSKVC